LVKEYLLKDLQKVAYFVMMIKRFCILILTLTTAGLFAQEIPTKAFLFITSDPIGAEIILNGEPLLETTPALVELKQGQEVSLELVKESYKSASSQFLLEGTTWVEELTLQAQFITTEFPGNTPEEGKRYYQIPEGDYEIDRGNAEFFLKPVYAKESTISILSLLTVPALGGTTALWFSQNNFEPSPTTIGISTLAVTLFLTNLYYHLDRKGHEDDFYEAVREVEPQVDISRELFTQADRYLQQGRFLDAEREYLRLLREIPDSPLYPLAYYKLARLHQIMGKRELSRRELNLLLKHYPHPDTYDRTLKSLADLALAEENTEEALGYFDQMLFVDPLFDRQEIDTIREMIQQ